MDLGAPWELRGAGVGAGHQRVAEPARGALRADTGDNVGVTQVEFGVRGVRRRIDTRAPYTWSLDTTAIADGPGEITATSFDAAGNSRVTTMNIVVDNSGPRLTIAP
jgi:hypothetical protein